MLVEVRPLDIKKWHGKEGKESFAQPKVIEALLDNNTGRYATGLTPEEAERYGKELGVDLSDKYNPNEPHSFWGTKPAGIILPNHTIIFNTDKHLDFVKVKVMKASKFVANSMRDYEEGRCPEATHVIFDEEEDISLKASKVQVKRAANDYAAKMSSDDKANMVQILSHKSVKGRSNDFIDVQIDEIIESKPAEFLKYAKMGRDEVYIRATILEAIHKGVLTKEGNAIFYMGDIVASDYEASIEWFKDPNNQKMKVAILEKLTSNK